jgi:hypothetical protein
MTKILDAARSLATHLQEVLLLTEPIVGFFPAASHLGYPEVGRVCNKNARKSQSGKLGKDGILVCTDTKTEIPTKATPVKPILLGRRLAGFGWPIGTFDKALPVTVGVRV